jgi:hypothetical protein
LALVSALRQAGFETWVDVENLKVGERWKDAINAALADSHALIFCVSPLSVESAWASVELKTALRRRLKIVPVMIRQVDLQLLPYSIRKQQILDMARWPAHAASTEAARAIAIALGVKSPLFTHESTCMKEAFETLWICMGGPSIPLLNLTLSACRLDQSTLKCWHVNVLTDTILAEVMASATHVRRAIVVIGDHADILGTSILVGALAALVGEWRLTIIECSGAQGVVEKCAALSRAYYVRFDAGVSSSRFTMPSGLRVSESKNTESAVRNTRRRAAARLQSEGFGKRFLF